MVQINIAHERVIPRKDNMDTLSVPKSEEFPIHFDYAWNEKQEQKADPTPNIDAECVTN